MKPKKTLKADKKKVPITSLLNAVKLGKEECIKSSLVHGLPKNAKKTTDYTILQASAKKNHTSISKLLIDAGCKINGNKDDKDYTPLAFAVKNENEEMAAYLLEKGATLEAGNGSDLTVLHLATQQKSLRMLELLLENTDDIDCIRSNKTAFQMFFDSSFPYTQLNDQNEMAIFKLFLLKGASIDINHDWSVLHFVSTTNHKNIIERVLQATTNVNHCTNEGNTSLHHLIQESSLDEKDIVDIAQSFILKGLRINIANNKGNTAFHLAANKKYLRLLQVFFLFKWNVNYCNFEGNTVLHNVLENSSSFRSDNLFYEVVTYILNMEFFRIIKNNQGISCLHLAIENDHKQIFINMLVKPGIDVNAPDSRLNNYTILHYYLKNLSDSNSEPDIYDIEIVSKLMLVGAQSDFINDQETKVTPMHYALIMKNTILLKLLLHDFNFQRFETEQGTSILYYLVVNIDLGSEIQELEMVEVAELCMEKGANVNFRDNQGKTPLSVAVLRRQKHMVKAFLENGVQINNSDIKLILLYIMENEISQESFSPSAEPPYNCKIMEIIGIPEDIARDVEILEMLSSKGMDLDNKSSKGFTIFHYAASKKYTEMLSNLLPHCKNANVRDPIDNTVLHSILSSYVNTSDDEENKLVEIVQVLLSIGASVLCVNYKGETPLHLAAKNRHFEIASLLLQHGADPTALDNHRNSGLHFLSMSNIECKRNAETDVMAKFVGCGCDIDAKNKDGMTPLLLAAQSGCTLITRILLLYGAKTNCTVDENLSTPLHMAAGCNHFEVVNELIKFGAEVNLKRKDGTTALHLAVPHKNSEITRMLLTTGADTEIKNENGKTALHYACWYNRFEAVNELLNYGANINAEDEFQVTPLMLIPDSGEIWTDLYLHVLKLRAANLMISKVNEKYIAQYVQTHSNDPAVSTACEFYDLAVAEISKMKEMPIGNCSLYDLLQMTPSNSHFFSNNETLCEILYSDDFEENFPLYEKLMKANYGKSIVRNGLLASAKNSLQSITGLSLEDHCWNRIFENLSDQDLRNINQATIIRFGKRKRSVKNEHPIEETSSKKYRRSSY